MSIDHRFLRAHPSEMGDALYQNALHKLAQLPLIRLSEAAPADDDDFGVAEIITPAEEAGIPKSEIIELAHYTDKRQLTELRVGCSASWADHLGISDQWIRKYTGSQKPSNYRSLYLIRVHAPGWPQTRNGVETVGRTGGPAAYEYRIEFKVLQGQFAEIQVTFSHQDQKMS